jgi:hypothetical protein
VKTNFRSPGSRWLHDDGELFELLLEAGEGAAGCLDVGDGGASLVGGDAVAALGEEAGEQLGGLEAVEAGTQELCSEEGEIVGGELFEGAHAWLDAD